ncbi:hypothetical protein [Maricaulis sp.]|uniref:hypothetical protein n=1 Tax=Maricaulis sp. TaxID=1486257 RepID=UPI003A90F910
MLSQLGLKKTCPACAVDLPGREIATANTGGHFNCPHCGSRLRWAIGPGLLISLGLALVSIPVAMHVSTHWPLPAFLAGLAGLITACAWLALRAMNPALVRPAETQG